MLALPLLLFLAASASAIHAPPPSQGLRDHPITSSGPPAVYLDTAWIASSATANISVPAFVPGDLLTDLQRAKVITDPWLDITWIQNSSLWAEHAWTYTTHFDAPNSSFARTSALRLVFDGVKMGATVRVNGHKIGVLADQFLRYTFTLDPEALDLLPANASAGAGANRLDVTFGLEDVAEDGRFMACTGGWDWAPFSYTTTNSSGNTTGPANTLSKGLWKSVYLLEVPLASVAITHLTPHTFYSGAYPTAPLKDGAHGGFSVDVTAHLWVPPGGATGALTVAGSWATNENTGNGGGDDESTLGDTVSNGIRKGNGDSNNAIATSNVLVLPAGESKVSLQLTATAKQIKLWWPSGVGAQPLYDVTATWTPLSSSSEDAVDRAGTTAPASSASPSSPPTSSSTTTTATTTTPATSTATRRMGFRVFALVTVNDTNATVVASNASGQVHATGTHGMFFRVNGAALYSRGANMVPMEDLEGRMDGEAHRILVKSSADAGMNTLRVWGGGIFFPTAFYDACDEYGLLVYHDMQYANNGGGTHGPLATPTQDAELRHQIRRLSHHPAIVVWDSNNEQMVNMNQTSEIFATFVMTVVAEEDQSRAVWPSSPAKGWATGVHRLYQTPSLGTSPHGLTVVGGGRPWNCGIETHAPYQTGGGWPTVNGGDRDMCFINNGMGNAVYVPNRLKADNPNRPRHRGVGQFNIYASEFGTTGSSSFESMSGTLSKHHWGMRGGMAADTCSGNEPGSVHCVGKHTCTGNNPMTQRNYACDGPIRLYFGNHTTVDLNATGAVAFKGQTYQCQLVQAFVLKQVYEARRAQNAFGHLVWMLNEIWPTVGWGSLEYGPPPGYTPGQVRGGRWKPLHYFYKRSLMADVMATCGSAGVCYISNHRASRAFTGTVTFTTYDHFGNGKGTVLLHKNVALPEGPGAIEWFEQVLPSGNDTAVVSTVRDETGDVLSEHMLQLVTPAQIRVPVAKVTFKVADKPNADGTVDIVVTSDKVALWVTLTTKAQGRFSDNAFFLPATTVTVRFVPFSVSTAAKDVAVLKSTLRVEDLSMYRAIGPATGA